MNICFEKRKMSGPFRYWEFHPSLHDRLEKFKQMCLETDPIPAELLSKIKQADNKKKDSSIVIKEEGGEMECAEEFKEPLPVDKEEESEKMTVFITPSQEPRVTNLFSQIEDGSLDKHALSSMSRQQLEFVLPKLSDAGITYLIESICALGSSNLASVLCSEYFLPQFSIEEKQCTRSILLAAKQVVEKFPHEACIHFLGPLLLKPLGSLQTLMAPFLGSVPLQQKLSLLRMLGDSNIQLTESQVVLINGLLMPLDDEQLIAKLISLLVVSGTELRQSAKFGQLLIAAIQKLGPSTTDYQREQLAILVAEHKTVARKLAERALKSLC